MNTSQRSPNSIGGIGASNQDEPSSKVAVKPRLGMFGLVLSVLGSIAIISAISAQAFSIDHGANQKPIDANNVITVWSIVLGALVLVLGVILWFHFGGVSGEFRYQMVYGLAFMSYVISTIALYMSTIQVIVKESSS